MNGRMVQFEFVRGQVGEARMWTHRVEVPPPRFDNHLGLAAAAEPLDAEAFVTELAVEGLVGAVLPRLAGIDDGGLNVRFGKPLQDRVTHELRTAVGAQVRRRAVRAHQARQHINHSARADTPGYVDRQALVGEFVDHGKTLELRAVGAVIGYEVVRPAVVGGSRRQWSRSSRSTAAAWAFARQSQPRLAPEPPCAIDAHGKTFPAQKDTDAAVAITRVLARQPIHRDQHRGVLFGLPQAIAQSRARHVQQPTGTSLRQTAIPQKADLFATPPWAHHFRRFTSRIRSTSRSRSASSRLSLAFSSSSAFNRFTSAGARPAKCLRQT